MGVPFTGAAAVLAVAVLVALALAPAAASRPPARGTRRPRPPAETLAWVAAEEAEGPTGAVSFIQRSSERTVRRPVVVALGRPGATQHAGSRSGLTRRPIRAAKRAPRSRHAAREFGPPESEPLQIHLPRWLYGYARPQLWSGVRSEAQLWPGDVEAAVWPAGPEEVVPSGSAIWDENKTWVSVRQWHPAGVISNLPQGRVVWAEASFLSISQLLVFTGVAYPLFLVLGMVSATICVSFCLQTHAQEDKVPLLADGTCDPLYSAPVLHRDQLNLRSQLVYAVWSCVCRLVPSLMVFGTPAVMMALARPFPQEVFAAVTLVTGAYIFSTGVYNAVFSCFAVVHLRAGARAQAADVLPEEARREHVVHWVIIPQYSEPIEVLTMTLESIGRSSLAAGSICVVLAMEQREHEAPVKAAQLQQAFAGRFRDLLVTWHPPNLPNDPKGKASNVRWAFRQLVTHVELRGADASSGVVLTIADADSEFHRCYFERLTHSYLTTDPRKRDLRFWQAPVLHLKNYHRQPSPVVCGTMFTCITELATLTDPNAVRFPYSTYSLSMNLARTVGGWDADWVAEDYHMGIKCYLLTMGRTQVEAIHFPTLNYTPEDDSWLSTLWARWVQAKRHAMGFSDVTYYFMMLPLIFSHASSHGNRAEALRAFWTMCISGMTLLIRLINIHTLIGVLSTYGILEAVLRFLMLLRFADDRHVIFLFTRIGYCSKMLMYSGAVSVVVTITIFAQLYETVKDRIEGKPFVRNSFVHLLRNVAASAGCIAIYTAALGIAVWLAAFNVIFAQSFEYEVALKPTTGLKASLPPALHDGGSLHEALEAPLKATPAPATDSEPEVEADPAPLPAEGGGGATAPAAVTAPSGPAASASAAPAPAAAA